MIANIALELMGKEKGDYSTLSPNDHVNMGQSSNDTFPTASHIAVIMLTDRLLPVIEALADTLELKGKEFMKIPKSGRTHLMDAMPVTLGYEFMAYGKSVSRGRIRVMERADDLLELPIGGTATGTGANAHPGLREAVIVKIARQQIANATVVVHHKNVGGVVVGAVAAMGLDGCRHDLSRFSLVAVFGIGWRCGHYGGDFGPIFGIDHGLEKTAERRLGAGAGRLKRIGQAHHLGRGEAFGQGAAALGGEQETFPAIGGAGLLRDVALIDQLLEHAGEALLGDVEQFQQVRDPKA